MAARLDGRGRGSGRQRQARAGGQKVTPGQLVADHASQGDVVLYDFNNDGTFDHESLVVTSDSLNPDSTTNWDQVDAHTNSRYHAYWTLAQYSTDWATTCIMVLHISPTTS